MIGSPEEGWYGLYLYPTKFGPWWHRAPAYLFRVHHQCPDHWGKPAYTEYFFILPFWPSPDGAQRLYWKAEHGPNSLQPFKPFLATSGRQGWRYGNNYLFPISLKWLQTNCTTLLAFRPPQRYGLTPKDNAIAYLDAVFGLDEGRIDNGVLLADIPDGKPMPPLRWGVVFSGLRYAGIEAWAITRGAMPRTPEQRWYAHFRRASSYDRHTRATLFVFDAHAEVYHCILHFQPEDDALILEQGVFNRETCTPEDVTPEAVDTLVRELIA